MGRASFIVNYHGFLRSVGGADGGAAARRGYRYRQTAPQSCMPSARGDERWVHRDARAVTTSISGGS